MITTASTRTLFGGMTSVKRLRPAHVELRIAALADCPPIAATETARTWMAPETVGCGLNSFGSGRQDACKAVVVWNNQRFAHRRVPRALHEQVPRRCLADSLVRVEAPTCPALGSILPAKHRRHTFAAATQAQAERERRNRDAEFVVSTASLTSVYRPSTHSLGASCPASQRSQMIR
jgi:hypothetical protein